MWITQGLWGHSHQSRGQWAVAALLTAVSISGLSLSPPAFAADQPIIVTLDQARLVKIPAGTQTLIIGNPTIADVTQLRQKDTMVLTAKAYGETNFIALDADGHPVAESMIQVVSGSNTLTLQRGMDRQSYSCAPKCQPVERLGDDDKYLGAVAAAAQSHTQRLAGSLAPSGPMTPH